MKAATPSVGALSGDLAVAYHVTPGDMWAFHRYLIGHERRVQQRYLVNALAGAVGAGVAGSSNGAGGVTIGLAVLLGGLLGGLGAFLWNWFSIRRSAKTSPHIAEPHALSLGKDGLTSRCSHATSDITWRAIRKVRSGRAAVYVFSGPCNGFVIPRRFFASGADADRFAAEAEAYRAAAG